MDMLEMILASISNMIGSQTQLLRIPYSASNSLLLLLSS